MEIANAPSVSATQGLKVTSIKMIMRNEDVDGSDDGFDADDDDGEDDDDDDGEDDDDQDEDGNPISIMEDPAFRKVVPKGKGSLPGPDQRKYLQRTHAVHS